MDNSNYEIEILFTYFAYVLAIHFHMGGRQIKKLWKLVDRLCQDTVSGKKDYMTIRETLEAKTGMCCACKQNV